MDKRQTFFNDPIFHEIRRRISFQQIQPIRAEASFRRFFRLSGGSRSAVAMVYPERNEAEIDKIVALSSVYRDHGLTVPAIRDVIAGQAVILEDAGDCLVQRRFRSAVPEEKRSLLRKIAGMLGRIASIPPSRTEARLTPDRMRREMDFFADHFLPGCRLRADDAAPLRQALYRLVERIDPAPAFAHRDFHSRNMLLHSGRIYLVDFQDSLVGPSGYDLASFAYDSYLDLGRLRHDLLAEAEKAGVAVTERQFILTALQRNIKALGTFAFQVRERRHLAYRMYIPRTLRHIVAHLRRLDECEFRPLAEFFLHVPDIEIG
jgi:hypothetical protein